MDKLDYFYIDKIMNFLYITLSIFSGTIMAHHKSAKKRIVLSKKQNERNRSYKSELRTALKRVLQSSSQDVAAKEFKKAESIIDKLSSRNIIHRNKAARKKSQLAAYVSSLT